MASARLEILAEKQTNPPQNNSLQADHHIGLAVLTGETQLPARYGFQPGCTTARPQELITGNTPPSNSRSASFSQPRRDLRHLHNPHHRSTSISLAGRSCGWENQPWHLTLLHCWPLSASHPPTTLTTTTHLFRKGFHL